MSAAPGVQGDRRLIGAVASSLAGRCAGGLLLLAFQALVARRAGVSDLGLVSIALAVSSFGAVAGRSGSDLLVLREVSVASDAARAGEAYRVALGAAWRRLLVVAVLQAATAPLVADVVFRDERLTAPLVAMAASLPGYGLVALQGEALKAMGRAGAGSVLQSIVGPATSIVLLLALPSPSATRAAVSFAAGTAVAAAAAHVVWTRSVGPSLPSTRARRRDHVVRSRPFLLTSLWTLGLMWAPLLTVGMWSGPRTAGAFAAADRVAQVLPMMLVAMNAAIGPPVAALWARHDIDGLRRLVGRCTTVAAGGALVVCAGLASAAPLVMSGFGSGSVGASELRILVLGQFAVLACGPVSITLAMIGGEAVLHRVYAGALIAQITLLAILVPAHGSAGAAVAAAITWAGSRGVTAVAMHRRLAHRPRVLTPAVSRPTGA
jgi:O-antigen/teichoic acid export membrane protein